MARINDSENSNLKRKSDFKTKENGFEANQHGYEQNIPTKTVNNNKNNAL